MPPRARRRRCGAAGFTSADWLVGSLVAWGVVLAGFVLLRGLATAGDGAAREIDTAVAARLALAAIAAQVARAGDGVAPPREAGDPDEPLELLLDGALAVRADTDRDDPTLAREPERWLTGRFTRVTTANDEVVVFARRLPGGGGPVSLSFDADLDADATAIAADGTPVAMRDGVVEAIDAGTALAAGDDRVGTLYQIRFSNDHDDAGTARFTHAAPLLDDVTDFRVRGVDRTGAEVPPCGGRDDEAGRSCRARIAAVVLEMEVAAGARRLRLLERVALGRREAP